MTLARLALARARLTLARLTLVRLTLVRLTLTRRNRGNTTDADLEEEAEPATEAPLRLLRMRTLPCGA